MELQSQGGIVHLKSAVLCVWMSVCVGGGGVGVCVSFLNISPI